ncbi:hypothetical protein OOZ15_17580 [Galbibacter sp. EGI 63066]|uniref:hypothetical protein n=1 Tax=Galbibacter sp. EGI 63066 TaxID=2993559 RepID=UPI002249306C|nr:hypothetical protein [Galbibacter sp. EGI 63066]MCX2681769.1 hypothetical protein [Galbibacter sp. EGI 63066]
MKRIFLLLALIVSNTTLFSCTDDSVAETDALYHQQANGEDGEINEDPDNPDPEEGN